MRDQFLTTFVTTYSLRPIEEIGSVFRRYPGLWQVFVADDAMPGRYKLAAEQRTRPAGSIAPAASGYVALLVYAASFLTVCDM